MLPRLDRAHILLTRLVPPFPPRRFVLIRCRPAVLWALLAVCALVVRAPEARAAAEVHKLSLLLSSNPSSLALDDFNSSIESYNNRVLDPHGLEGLDPITFAWINEAELRYFVTPNIAIGAGVGQIRKEVRREFFPRIAQNINVRANVVAAPIHVGSTFYLAPYNQGDFRARAYLSGGIMAVTNGKFFFEQLESGTDTTTTIGGSYRVKGRGEAPGYYAEFGVQMWFPSRFSVMLGATYRSMDIRTLRYESVRVNPDGSTTPFTPADIPETLDFTGLGVRMAVVIGL